VKRRNGQPISSIVAARGLTDEAGNALPTRLRAVVDRIARQRAGRWSAVLLSARLPAVCPRTAPDGPARPGLVITAAPPRGL
jgi:hypothetical protein